MKRSAICNTPQWKDTYIVHVGPRVLEIDRPTGAKRTLKQQPIRFDVKWVEDEKGYYWGILE